MNSQLGVVIWIEMGKSGVIDYGEIESQCMSVMASLYSVQYKVNSYP